MKLKFTFSFAIIILLFSCNNQQENSTFNKPVTKPNPLNCYRYTNNNDTFTLKTISVNGFTTGTLVYNFHEKDRSRGTIQGRMKGDLLIADYTYNSEGLQSIRQVVFKKNGNSFVEGYGETEDKNGKTTFKNIDSLNFGQSIIYKEIDCEK